MVWELRALNFERFPDYVPGRILGFLDKVHGRDLGKFTREQLNYLSKNVLHQRFLYSF